MIRSASIWRSVSARVIGTMGETISLPCCTQSRWSVNEGWMPCSGPPPPMMGPLPPRSSVLGGVTGTLPGTLVGATMGGASAGVSVASRPSPPARAGRRSAGPSVGKIAGS